MHTTKSVRRLKRPQRYITARQFVGRHVEIERRYVGLSQILQGEVVVVALSTSGSADVMVLRVDGVSHPEAYSLAQIESIKEIHA